MKRVLVIGGSGFAGRHAILELSKLGYEIIAMEHRTPVPSDVQTRIISGGIGAVDRKLIREVRPDLVFHFARPTMPALRGAGRFLAARYAARLNRKLTGEIARSGHPLKLVFASGSLMYGPSKDTHDEDAPLNPSSYARQYQRGELPILRALHENRQPVIVMRFPWLLGNGSWFEWYYLMTMERTGAVPLFGNGDNLMEITDIRDAVKLAIKSAEALKTSSVINVPSARPVSQLEFAEAVSVASGLPVRDYRELFRGRIEKAALQAFSSNIVLMTKYEYLLKDFHFTPLGTTLSRVLEEYRQR